MIEFISDSVEETYNIAFSYAASLRGGDVIVLDGEMGAGKTHFVKGLAKGLMITDEVTSPTYAYLNVYGDKLYHYDCYRLSSAFDAENLGLTDYFGAKDIICVLEWAKNISEAIPKNHKTVKIEILSDNKRKITINE